MKKVSPSPAPPFVSLINLQRRRLLMTNGLLDKGNAIASISNMVTSMHMSKIDHVRATIIVDGYGDLRIHIPTEKVYYILEKTLNGDVSLLETAMKSTMAPQYRRCD